MNLIKFDSNHWIDHAEIIALQSDERRRYGIEETATIVFLKNGTSFTVSQNMERVIKILRGVNDGV